MLGSLTTINHYALNALILNARTPVLSETSMRDSMEPRLWNRDWEEKSLVTWKMSDRRRGCYTLKVFKRYLVGSFVQKVVRAHTYHLLSGQRPIFLDNCPEYLFVSKDFSSSSAAAAVKAGAKVIRQSQSRS